MILHIARVIFILLEVLILFNLLIVVHELGHFLAARWRGLYIEKFGVWFRSRGAIPTGNVDFVTQDNAATKVGRRDGFARSRPLNGSDFCRPTVHRARTRRRDAPPRGCSREWQRLHDPPGHS